MEAGEPAMTIKDISKDKMIDDLKKNYQQTLIKHLDDRTYNEDNIKTWINYILSDAKKFSIKNYPDYDIFLYCFISQRNVYFNSNDRYISTPKTDGNGSTSFRNDNIYCQLKFFIFKHYPLEYSLNTFESEIIAKGNELMIKYLEDRKYNPEKNDNYIENINKEHFDYILSINNKLKCFAITYIFQIPIKGKYYFNYTIHGKDIYKTMFQSYQNGSLLMTHDVFFFK